ncbi:MAG: hypothetical protein BWY75_03297 [bacterium ADurb.Bin425]|nr:MAG: hypothetical protein BWY75_03297 [bacterium ADurb.Bin425]
MGCQSSQIKHAATINFQVGPQGLELGLCYKATIWGHQGRVIQLFEKSLLQIYSFALRSLQKIGHSLVTEGHLFIERQGQKKLFNIIIKAYFLADAVILPIEILFLGSDHLTSHPKPNQKLFPREACRRRRFEQLLQNDHR